MRELRPWIDRRLAEAGRQRAAVLARGDTLPYLGQTLTVHAEPGRTRVTRRGDSLLVPLGPQRPAAIERWYRQRARAEIQPRLDRACALAGLTYARLSIRDQRTRWGSCSRTGAISFNWRLLLAPEAVLDYVDLARGLPSGVDGSLSALLGTGVALLPGSPRARRLAAAQRRNARAVRPAAEQIVAAIREWQAGHSGPLVIAIDGYGASGKTTIASEVAIALDAVVSTPTSYYEDHGPIRR